MFFPARISRYAFGELLPPFFLGLSLYTFVLLMNHFFIIAEKTLTKKLGWDLTWQLFMTGIPMVLVLALPMSVLLGVMIAVGRLSADHEWVAMQSSGMGPARLLRPIALFGILTTLLTFFVFSELVPEAHFAQRSLNGKVLTSSNLATDLKPRVFYTSIPDVVLFVEDIRPTADKKLQGVLLFTRNRVQRNRTIIHMAQEGDLFGAQDGSGELVADLFMGTSHEYTPESGENYIFGGFDRLTVRIPTIQFMDSILNPSREVPDLRFAGVWDALQASNAKLADLRASVAAAGGKDEGNQLMIAERLHTNVALEFHSRLALPVACFLFALLALPLGVTRVRSGKGAGFAISLLVILVYWVAFTVGRNQSVAGVIPSWMGPWIGNFLVAPWATVALWRMHGAEGDRDGLFAKVYRGMVRMTRHIRKAFGGRSIRKETEELEASGNEDPLESLSGTPNRFIGRFDRYVAMTYLRILLLALLSTYLLSAMIEFKGLMDDVVRTNQSPVRILEYLKYFAPGLLSKVLPISCLVGAVITFTLLSRNGELTALKASGISMRRATVPVLLCTLVLCALQFLIDDRIAPASNRAAREVRNEITGRPRVHSGVNGSWSFGPDGQTLYQYDRFNPATGEYRALTIFRLNRQIPEIRELIYGDLAVFENDRWELTEPGWHRKFTREGLRSGYEALEPGPLSPTLAQPDELEKSQFAFTRSDELSEQMSVHELREEIYTLDQRGYDTTRLWVQLHGKWSAASAPLVMVLLGLPFAFKVGRRGSLYGVGVSLLLVLVYWATHAIFNALGLETVLDPLFAAWGPNILFGLVGTYLMLYIKT